jgi:hypothetical protein
MTTTERILLAVIIVAVDLLTFAIPLTAFAAAHVMVARPPGFLEWVRRLYGVPEAKPRRIGPIVSIVRKTALGIGAGLREGAAHAVWLRFDAHLIHTSSGFSRG